MRRAHPASASGGEREELHDRWFFQAVATAPLPEEWLGGEDSAVEGWIPFRFFWLSRAEAAQVLTPDHAEVVQLTVGGGD